MQTESEFRHCQPGPDFGTLGCELEVSYEELGAVPPDF